VTSLGVVDVFVGGVRGRRSVCVGRKTSALLREWTAATTAGAVGARARCDTHRCAFAASHVLVAPRAADFHRVFAQACVVKGRRRVARSKSCVSCNGDARRGCSRFMCWTASFVESATSFVAVFRFARVQPQKNAKIRTQQTSGTVGVRICKAGIKGTRARPRTRARGGTHPWWTVRWPGSGGGCAPWVGNYTTTIKSRARPSRNNKRAAELPLQILWQNRVLQRHHRLLLLISWQCLPHVEGVLRAAIIP